VRHRNLGHLECDVAAMSNDLGADLDQLLPDGGQRPMLHLVRQPQGPHEVGEIVSKRMKLEPDRVVVELAARQPRQFDRRLTLLDPLFRRAALVVERHDALGGTPQVGDDEADAGIELGCHSTLANHAALAVPRSGLIAESGVIAADMVGRATDGAG
jgi:hypothetical protein